MKKIVILIILLITIVACKSSQQTTSPQKDAELEELFLLMQGSFNSENQSKANKDYYDISLHMYPIWKEKGHFLYVEQALSNKQNKPYRQRIYEVKRIDKNTLASYIYTIPNDSLWVGKLKKSKEFNKIQLKDIELRNGCEVLLKKLNTNHFKGKTGKNTCESSLRGASYATSEVEILPNKIISWDRGFNVNDEYVWGAKKAGYIFEKIN